MDTVLKVDLPYVNGFVDRHGRPRFYLRKDGKCLPIKVPQANSEAFRAEYEKLLKQLAHMPDPKAKVEKPKTLAWLGSEYISSAHKFAKLDERSQRVKKQILLNAFDEPVNAGDLSQGRFGDVALDELTPKAFKILRDRKKNAPTAANRRTRFLSQMFDWAVEQEFMSTNPAKVIERLDHESEGYHSWTEEEVIKFCERHHAGSKARLAVSLLLLTGLRRSDVVRIGPGDVVNGVLIVKPKKTEKSTKKVLHLPILPQLRAILDTTDHGSLAFLQTEYGNPFTANGFGGWFRDRCDEAGLPHCTAHGLRKAGAAMVAENGATEQQMMAIFGWDSARLAAHYAKAASQKKLAAQAMHLLAFSALDPCGYKPSSEGLQTEQKTQ